MKCGLAGIAMLGMAMTLVGCAGGEDYAYENPNPDPPEVVYANEVRTQLEDMKRQLNNEGPGAVDTVSYIEGMEGYGEDAPVGENGAVFAEIHSGVKEIQQMIESGSGKGEIEAKIDELLAKAPAATVGGGSAESTE